MKRCRSCQSCRFASRSPFDVKPVWAEASFCLPRQSSIFLLVRLGAVQLVAVLVTCWSHHGPTSENEYEAFGGRFLVNAGSTPRLREEEPFMIT